MASAFPSHRRADPDLWEVCSLIYIVHSVWSVNKRRGTEDTANHARGGGQVSKTVWKRWRASLWEVRVASQLPRRVSSIFWLWGRN